MTHCWTRLRLAGACIRPTSPFTLQSAPRITRTLYPASVTNIVRLYAAAPSPTPAAQPASAIPPTPSTVQPSNASATASPELPSSASPPSPSFSLATYASLAKARLAALVVLTTMAGYAVAPMAVTLPTLLATTAGTALCVASANSLNQWVEAPYDAQMKRTRTRVLVTHTVSGFHAFSFGIASGIAGFGTLYAFVNPITAVLGLANIVLYAGVYTPMKRFSIYNTWVGALVGAIPPIMGWTACTGTLDAGAIFMGAILFAWQFPHFNALSWNLRADYSKAGYHMMSVTDPALNARVSLRYAAALIPLCAVAPVVGISSWTFVAASSVVNGAFFVTAYRFWKNSNDKTARELFFMSLLHLPVLLGLLMVFKL
ncbi:protoheme IX farnesyltransferase [Rhizoclosmatium globosum]|uniref:Protoheme IX farnesyltransferase, mitochondrial n=1 Tax=Rhizoclosmatium globosum TaxID=329046 RepID=A0A1Y2C820_9FUNG|nr:protoheme IX farnesyltransferase [Rhizoclosmatium globosum]|eukprot:ORY43047.1 protoheme IX farnesyltransferase [Rhizoclosmatium globosum]